MSKLLRGFRLPSGSDVRGQANYDSFFNNIVYRLLGLQGQDRERREEKAGLTCSIGPFPSNLRRTAYNTVGTTGGGAVELPLIQPACRLLLCN